MIDTDAAEQILQGDDTHPDILQALGLELLAEVKRLLEVVDEQQMQYVSLETAYYNSPSQIEVKRLEDQTWQANAEYVELEKEVKRLRNESKNTHMWIEYTLLRLENRKIDMNECIELMWDMCGSPEHKAIVEQKWEGEEE